MDYEKIIIEALYHWKPYLYVKFFILYMDYQPLICFFAQPNFLGPSLIRVAENLAIFFSNGALYTIVHMRVYKHSSRYN